LKSNGISAEVVFGTVKPIDEETIIKSTKKLARLL
jgi:transketolase C-terminal domain/subunit